MTTTIPRPVLSERQRDMLKSLGLTWQYTDLCVIVECPDQTITRLDCCEVDTWVDGFCKGRTREVVCSLRQRGQNGPVCVQPYRRTAMRAILQEIDEIGRECRPSPTRLGIYCPTPHRTRTWRSAVLETVLTGCAVFLVLCILYVVVGAMIGAAKGAWSSGNDLCVMLLRAVGR
jgi:hypothetical protein